MPRFTERQRKTSRRASAQSPGPVTPRGKAISRLNGFVHGLASPSACLAVENPQKYEALRAAVHARFTPTCDFEREIADEITAQTWQYRRADYLHAALLEHKMGEMEKDLEANYQKIDSGSRVALAFVQLRREGDPLDSLDRYQTRRLNQRARNIQLLRGLLAEPADDDAPSVPPTEPGGVEVLSAQAETPALEPVPQPQPDPPSMPESDIGAPGAMAAEPARRHPRTRLGRRRPPHPFHRALPQAAPGHAGP